MSITILSIYQNEFCEFGGTASNLVENNLMSLYTCEVSGELLEDGLSGRYDRSIVVLKRCLFGG